MWSVSPFHIWILARKKWAGEQDSMLIRVRRSWTLMVDVNNSSITRNPALRPRTRVIPSQVKLQLRVEEGGLGVIRIHWIWLIMMSLGSRVNVHRMKLRRLIGDWLLKWVARTVDRVTPPDLIFQGLGELVTWWIELMIVTSRQEPWWSRCRGESMSLSISTVYSLHILSVYTSLCPSLHREKLRDWWSVQTNFNSIPSPFRSGATT